MTRSHDPAPTVCNPLILVNGDGTWEVWCKRCGHGHATTTTSLELAQHVRDIHTPPPERGPDLATPERVIDWTEPKPTMLTGGDNE